TDSVSSVVFSPDGRTLAAGSADDTVTLWDLTDRAAPHRLGTPLTGPTNSVSSVVFSPDGQTLAAGSYDHTVTLWDAAQLFTLRDHADTEACRLLGSSLSADLWKLYIPDLPYQKTCP
ncbi:WD40 repeat domain-containing protein, partial [Frankia sp. R82]|uniref:WD40 repeat domain-containing protein n=1 Tax=Frankia sp. R82 TaxID=2950553 RepID=UPI0035ABC52B|nr:hypothetical protein [Frankia sp. R82]